MFGFFPKQGLTQGQGLREKVIHLEDVPQSMSEWEGRVTQRQRKSQYEDVLQRSWSIGADSGTSKRLRKCFPECSSAGQEAGTIG